MKVNSKVVIGDALSYTAKDWLRFGDVAEPTTRQKMILLAIEQITKVGPADFTAVQVCDRLDIKHPMINYHFGSRDNFMAEVSWWAHTEWYKDTVRRYTSAPADPKKRLRAWIEGELAYSKRMGGMQILIQYPMVSANALRIISDRHTAEMQRQFEHTLALLTTTVRDVQRGTVDPLDWDIDTIPKQHLLKDSKYFLTATKMAWTLHGLAMWSSGKHLSTHNIEDPKMSSLTQKFVVESMVKHIVDMASKA